MSNDKLSIARCPHMSGKYFDLHKFLHLYIFLPKFGSSQTSAVYPTLSYPMGCHFSRPQGGISGMFQRELTNSFTLVFPWMLGFGFACKLSSWTSFIQQTKQVTVGIRENEVPYYCCTVNLCLLEETLHHVLRRCWAWIHPQQSKRIDVRKMLKHDLVLVEEMSVPRVLRVCGWYDWGSRLTKCDALKSYYFGTRFGTIIKVLQ